MEYLFKSKYWDIVEDYNLDKLLYLLIDRPDSIGQVVYNSGVDSEYCWHNNKNKFHRKYNLPSFVWFNGVDGEVSWLVYKW